MSSDIGTGRKTRKILTVMAAVFAVAMMIAVPFLSAVDSEASFTAGEAGKCVTAKDASDAELTKYGLEIKSAYMTGGNGTEIFLKIFNTFGPFGTPELSSDSYTVKDYSGIKVDSDRTDAINGVEATFEKVKMVYTATSGGALLHDSYDDYKDAVAAIKAEFGDEISKDDKIIITGDIKSRIASKDIHNFAKVDDKNSVIKDSTESSYALWDVDVTIEFIHNGNSKTISFYSNQKFQVDTEATYDYKGKEYKDLKEGDKYNVSYIDKYYFESGSTYYKVAGEEYKIDIHKTPTSPKEDETVSYITDEEINFELNLYKKAAELIPDSEGNMTVGKDYADADSAYSDLAASVAMDDILKIVLIIVGVVIGIIVLVVILIIVLVVLKKKKK